jgi:DNA-directed RNA polymerase subunit H (RpoH/RPB5)
MAKFDVRNHQLVPQHLKVSEKEKKEIFEKYCISEKNLPKIFAKDPAIAHLNAKEGDVIKVVRPSMTAGESAFYRRVSNA